jgi:serine/threonine-protein kinase
MSPEQCKGTGDVDHRADLYSIGCIFYEMVTGRPPFDQRGAGELIGAHLFMEPQRPSQHGAEVTHEAEALIMSLLSKEPARRPQTAQDLGHLLAELATRGGYGSSTNWERPSMRAIPNPTHATEPTAHFTPSHTPAPHYTPSHTPVPAHYTPGHPGHYTPAPGVPIGIGHGPSSPHLTPGHGPSSPHLTPGHGPSAPQLATPYPPERYTPMPGPTPTDKPTTLSGAASEATLPPRSSRKLIAILGGLAFVGALVATFAIIGSGDDHASSSGHVHDGSHEHGPGNTHPVKAAKPAEPAKPVDTMADKANAADVANAAGVAKADDVIKAADVAKADEATDAANAGAANEVESAKAADTTKTVEVAKAADAAKEANPAADTTRPGNGKKTWDRPKQAAGTVKPRNSNPQSKPKKTDPLLETDL